MPTAHQIITQAFFDGGWIPAGGDANESELADGLIRLNQMLSSWSLEGASVRNRVNQSFALSAGVTSYTLGAGGTFATTGGLRAMKVTHWRAVSGQMVKGGAPLAMEEFAQAASAMQRQLMELTSQASLEGIITSVPGALTAAVPTLVGADTNYPLCNIRVFPPPSAAPGNLELGYWTPFAQFAGLESNITMPEGLDDSLHFNLALRLHSQYGRQTGIDPVLAANAQNTKAALVAWNTMASQKPAPVQQTQQ